MKDAIDLAALLDPDPAPVPADHPLRETFRGLVTRAFRDTLGIPEEAISAYVADMLADFALNDNLYRVRGIDGSRLHEVAGMLMEADVRANATSFERERSVHKHIGDFTLFWCGVYPEGLERMRARSADRMIDYVRQGKQSYHIVSTFRYGKYADQADLFRRLSEEFEVCRYGLSLVRESWERMERGRHRV